MQDSQRGPCAAAPRDSGYQPLTPSSTHAWTPQRELEGSCDDRFTHQTHTRASPHFMMVSRTKPAAWTPELEADAKSRDAASLEAGVTRVRALGAHQTRGQHSERDSSVKCANRSFGSCFSAALVQVGLLRTRAASEGLVQAPTAQILIYGVGESDGTRRSSCPGQSTWQTRNTKSVCQCSEIPRSKGMPQVAL